jgi:hypothetical protein
MGFRCGVTGKHSGSKVKPVVVTYYIEKEYDNGTSHIARGREVVRQVMVLPEVAPQEREVLLPGMRAPHAPPPKPERREFRRDRDRF